ncbi:hypothetical protein BC826DRAFT_1106863 [Russula brevipes]|nr:hypothetical protein BC826DRAFT_1106863 [Russula brevipes]
MSYYPDHVYFQSPSTHTPITPSPRKCSVKGCTNDLAPDYALKMCEPCRGRHRKYATTKRAKRKQEKAAVGAQRVGNDDGRAVTWMPQDPHISLGPIPEGLDSVPNMLVSQIDPRLFNPTSSELAGALTLAPLDPSSDLQGAYSSTPTQPDGASASSSAGPPVEQSRYCTVKGCHSVLSNDYFFKMCPPCRNRYRGYGVTKRSKTRRVREVVGQELQRARVEEDLRRAQEGRPLIGELQAAERRAWERKALESIPPPPVVQYEPISVLPVRLCTVSHCHTMLDADYPYRRCERHRLQNRHHSKLKRVRDKKEKSKAIGSLYTNEPLDLDARALDIEGAELSEYEDFPDEDIIPPPARGIRRSNTACSVKWCQNVLYIRSPWKMCEAHREKYRTNRRRRLGHDTCAASDLDEDLSDDVDEDSVGAIDMRSDSEPASPGLEIPVPTAEQASPALETPASEPSIIFMNPLLPPDDPPITTLQHSELSERPSIPPQVDPLFSYGSNLLEAGVLSESTAGSDVAHEVSSRQRVSETSLSGEHCVNVQEMSSHSQHDISSMAWGSTVSPVSASSTDSIPAQSTPSSSTLSNATVTVDLASSPPTTASATLVPAPFPGTSTSASHTQPQLQVPYYMAPPFSIPYTPGQPPILVPGPYPSCVPRPPYTYGAPLSGPFQAFPYAMPPPGQLAPYALRPYPYLPWGPYGSGAAEVNGFDASVQAQIQVQRQVQGHARTARRKRGRGGAASEDGLQIVLVQPMNSLSNDVNASATSTTACTPSPGPTRTVPDPSRSPPTPPSLVAITATSPRAEAVSSDISLSTPADSGEEVVTVGLFS